MGDKTNLLLNGIANAFSEQHKTHQRQEAAWNASKPYLQQDKLDAIPDDILKDAREHKFRLNGGASTTTDLMDKEMARRSAPVEPTNTPQELP